MDEVTKSMLCALFSAGFLTTAAGATAAFLRVRRVWVVEGMVSYDNIPKLLEALASKGGRDFALVLLGGFLGALASVWAVVAS